MGIIFSIVEKFTEVDIPRFDLISFQRKATFHIDIAELAAWVGVAAWVSVDQDAAVDISNSRLLVEKARAEGRGWPRGDNAGQIIKAAAGNEAFQVEVTGEGIGNG
jgi:hypothetical protein